MIFLLFSNTYAEISFTGNTEQGKTFLDKTKLIKQNQNLNTKIKILEKKIKKLDIDYFDLKTEKNSV